MHPDDDITKHFRLTEPHKKALARLKLHTILDLLYHFPARYIGAGDRKQIATLTTGESVTLYGTISKLKAKKTWKGRVPSTTGVLSDDSGSIAIIWFHQPYLANMFPSGSFVKVSGSVTDRNGTLSMANPKMERVADIPPEDDSLFENEGDTNSGELSPIYPESRGVTSQWFYYTIQKILAEKVHEHIEDPLPRELLKTYNLPSLSSAFVWIHAPQKSSDASAARKRFSFEEIFFIQLARQRDRARTLLEPSFVIAPEPKTIESFISRFPFTPTDAQRRAIDDILHDFKTPGASSRLLEGDVGSGKTFVAAVLAHAVVTTKPKGQSFGNLQVTYMAPTEILATQLYESFIQFFKETNIQIGLITGSGARKFPSKVNPNSWTDISRPQLLKWAANGEIPILIGTHALIQKKVMFKHLALVIIDEQHRFGTRQRAELARKDTDKQLPHLLTMTATPIPRTLALTMYGDLDLTLLDELPKGRKHVATSIVPPTERAKTYEHIRSLLQEGRQAYVICPRIDEPDEKKANAIRAKSAKTEAARLKKDIFPEFEVELLHGSMTAPKKDAAMKRFTDGIAQILVATSVVEVGVNVPNATMIIIEGAERFGLAQLHQLRGRVQRSSKQAYCYLFTDSKNETTLERLKALEIAKNGFELAEKDLNLRGAGDLAGAKQWGITDIGMEALKNLKMVEAARNTAADIVKNDPELLNHPLLAAHLASREHIHLE